MKLGLFFCKSLLSKRAIVRVRRGGIMATMDGNRYTKGGYKTVIVAVVLVFMQLLLLSGRCYSRRLQKIMLEADDYVLILATVGEVRVCSWPG